GRARPATRAHGALLAHITGGHIETIDAGPRSFQPMNVNFGLFPPLAQAPTRGPDGERLRGPAKTLAKKRALTARALDDLAGWVGGGRVAAAAQAQKTARRAGRRSSHCRRHGASLTGLPGSRPARVSSALTTASGRNAGRAAGETRCQWRRTRSSSSRARAARSAGATAILVL